MNLHFTFSVREISEIADDEQTLRIPMYLSVEWEVSTKRDFSAPKFLHKKFSFWIIFSFSDNS